MAVNLKPKNGAKAIFSALDIDDSVYDALLEKGVKIEHGLQGLTFSYNGKVASKVALNAQALNLLMKGKLSGPVAKKALADAVSEAVMKAMAAVGNPHSDELLPPEPENAPGDVPPPEPVSPALHAAMQAAKSAGVQSKAAKTLDKADTAGMIETILQGQVPDELEGTTSMLDLLNGIASAMESTKQDVDAVSLAEATRLYQPVNGSSSGSVYYTAALFKDMKLAARLKGQTLSVRVEGAVEKHKHLLIAAGLGLKSDYASEHFACGNTLLAQRTLGAIISALSEAGPLTPMPNMTMIFKG